MHGQAPCLLTSRSIHPDQSLEATDLLPASVRLQIKSHIIVAKAISALTENGLSHEAACRNNMIGMILQIFKEQINDLESVSGPLEGYFPLMMPSIIY